MNNLKLRILEQAYAKPHLTVWGLADSIGPGHRTEREVLYLVKKGYLLDDRGLELSEKGLAYIDSASLTNRAKRIGKWLLGIATSVVAVIIGNWLWELIQLSF